MTKKTQQRSITMKKKVLIPAVLCGVLLATSAISYPWSQNGSRNGDGQRGQRGMNQGMTLEQHEQRVDQQLKRMSVLLELTEKQQTQLQEIFDQQWQSRTKMRENMQASRDALLAYRLNDKFDEAEFRKLAEKQADLRTEMRVDRETNRNTVQSVLTADQQEKLAKLGYGNACFNGRNANDGHNRGKTGKGANDGRGGKW
jgi:protein CpxP